MPGGVYCLVLNVGDLDGDGGPELICERYLSMGVMYVPQVFRFEDGRYIDRTGRFPALLRATADDYRCATDIARFDAWTLLNELVQAYPQFDLGPVPANPDRLWYDAVRFPTCVLAACIGPLRGWSDASVEPDENPPFPVDRYMEFAHCLIDETGPELEESLDSILQAILDSLAAALGLPDRSSPGRPDGSTSDSSRQDSLGGV